MNFTITDFVRESNRIEGIYRAPPCDIAAHAQLLALDRVTLGDLVAFIAIIQPNAVLRDRPGLDVYVGDHVPPPGSAHIPVLLDKILEVARVSDPYHVHQAYETLHPFTDGNGRSGRALWLWMMGGMERAPLGFLHHWYYQSLAKAGYRGKADTLPGGRP